MPRWGVSDYTSLWIHDEPLGYQPAAGPRISFEVANKQRDESSGLNPKIFGVGRRWSFSWLSYVTLDSNGSNRVHFSDARERTFLGPQDYLTNTRLTGDTNSGFTLAYPDGSKDVYGFIASDGSGAFSKAFMTERWNASNQKTTLYYTNWTTGPVTRLLYVVDGDGRTNRIYYVSANDWSTNLISQIVDPFNRTNFLQYHPADPGHPEHAGWLTTVVDVQGLTNSFGYDDNERVNSMTTPYGTTSFELTAWALDGGPANSRSVLITQPDGGHQLYVSRDGAVSVPASYPTNEVPNTSPFSNTFDNSEVNFHNVFYWGSRQYANLSTTTIANFNANDYRKAHLRHFLKSATNLVGRTLSMERDPSPDAAGAIEGQKTWYDYAGKTNSQYEGTQDLPLLVARVLPDGSTSFTRSDRNSYGAVTTNISTFSGGLRTNISTYATGDIDMLTSKNAYGVQVSSNSYNAYHQILTNYNALGEMTTYTYDGSSHLLTSVARPAGLTTTNIYNGNGQLTSTYDYAAGPVYYRTNSYTYTNDLVLTHTDERGLVTTFTYDNLQRITNASDSRGAITYVYTNLGLIKVIDRMAFTNTFAYDSMRRKVGETNALGYHTSFSYCTCGSLDSIQDAAGNNTYFFYDNQGRLVNTTNTDSFSVSNNYNLLGQLTNTVDSAGTRTTNYFNNQGLLVATYNAYGQVQSTIYDALDRATNSTDANGVTTVSTYDDLNRLRARTYPDTGVERMGYTFNTAGLTSYTNQINNVTRYGYDPLSRKITETNANLEGIGFNYSPAGDLLTLTDGKGQTTTWHYDQFGRATNKVDALSSVIFKYTYDLNNRLTNRWTPEKGNAAYRYDAVGNLTNIAYAAYGNVLMAYDMLNRMTNMVDTVGTTKRTYDPAGMLLTEDGPFDSDTVTNTYVNRLRTRLSLQQPSASWTNAFAYDLAKRLTNVLSPAGSFAYTLGGAGPASALIKKLALPNGSRITNNYDNVARQLGTFLKNSGGSALDTYAYLYDPASERTNLTRADASTVGYRYDNIGQLKVADSSVNAEDRGYTYDTAWNLNYRTNNGSTSPFIVNPLNELTNALSQPLSYDSNGNLTSNGGQIYTYDDDNRLVSWSQGAPSSGALGSTFAYDGLGRLRTRSEFVGDGHDWILQTTVNYIYDGMRVIQERDMYNNPQVSYTRGLDLSGTLEGAGGIGGLLARSHGICTNYIGLHVRNSTIFNEDFSVGSLSDTSHVGTDTDYPLEVASGQTYTISGPGDYYYIQFPWTLPFVPVLDHYLLEFTGDGGINLSGSGNPLCDQDATVHEYYYADGNGNVTTLIDGDENVVASYRYDPFGNTISQSGGLADANVYRFSSKEVHAASGMYYYGYRFYDPAVQRWINRDPIGEKGGYDLYSFVLNDPNEIVDSFGLNGTIIITHPDGTTTIENVPSQPSGPWIPPSGKPRNESHESQQCDGCPGIDAWPHSPLDYLNKGSWREVTCLAKETGCLNTCAERFFSGKCAQYYEPCKELCHQKKVQCDLSSTSYRGGEYGPKAPKIGSETAPSLWSQAARKLKDLMNTLSGTR
jgi:RHS repeat-associated protein